LPSLKIRRLRTIAVETLKIIHKQSPSYLHELISIKDQKYNFRYQEIGASANRYGLNSFRYNAAQIWNDLPNHFRQETSLEHFKNVIQTWNGSSCQCSACRWPLNCISKFSCFFLNIFISFFLLLLLKCMNLLFLTCFCSVDICFCILCVYWTASIDAYLYLICLYAWLYVLFCYIQ